MATMIDLDLRGQLEDRRQRLKTAIPASSQPAALEALLNEVDAALERMDAGTYGLCEACHDPIEAERLAANPLARVCLGDLSPDEQRALEHDLETAAGIQRSLLPRPDHRVAGWDIHYCYEPAGPVSGDYCDVVAPANGEAPVFFALGDISGKGVSASLLMAHLQAILRGLLATHASVDALVASANRVFCESTLARRYATLVCGRATAAGEVELCNAGHWPPLLLRSGDAAVATIAATGLPIGMFSSGSFTRQTLRLAPGDVLLLYTDGLSEAQNQAGAEYGLDRARAVLTRSGSRPAAGIVGACLEDLRAFRDGTARKDDLAIMAIRRVA